jgi:hypothetical protein
MKAATNVRMRLDSLDEGTWLNSLLADIQAEIARQPTMSAIERMRNRVLQRIKHPTQAAA